MAGRWKRHEREVAAALAGIRLPNTGAGQPDVLARVSGVPCAVQVKTRALPAWLLAALDQAARDAGDRLPILVLSTAAPGVKARRWLWLNSARCPRFWRLCKGLFMATRLTKATKEFAETFPKIPALVRHAVRCGKPNCRCARGELHESWRLTWRDGAGRQRRRYVRKADVETVRGIVQRRRAEQRETRAALLAATRGLAGLSRFCRELERLERQR